MEILTKFTPSFRLILFLLALPVFGLAQQFPVNNQKIVQGVGTTAQGISSYSSSPPTTAPTAATFRHVTSLHMDTVLQVQYIYKRPRWYPISVVRRSTPPPATASSGSTTIDYTESIWQSTADSLTYYYEEENACWQPIGTYLSSTTPSDVAATGSTGAICYGYGLWYDPDVDSIYAQQGATWTAIGSGASGAVDSIVVLQDSIIVGYGAGVEVTRDTIGYPPTATGYSDWTAAADSGTPAVISDGETVTHAGGYGINTVISGNTITSTADTSELVTPYDISGLPSGTGTDQRIVVWTGTNSQGNSTQLQSAAGVTLDANLAYRITGGTTASRPTGAAGMQYWNTSNGWLDLHNGTAWFNPARSATTNGLFTAGSVLFGNSDGTVQQDNANFFWDDTNNRMGVGTITPDRKLDILDASAAQLRLTHADGSAYADLRATSAGNLTITPSSNNVSIPFLRLGSNYTTSTYIFPFDTNAGVPDATKSNLSFYNYSGSSSIAGGAVAYAGSPFLQTSGSQIHTIWTNGFTPTSGTASFSYLGVVNAIINQTGGANGITRGLFINPTLTSAADWRAVEIGSNSGFGLYQSGAIAKNYFAGNTGIGTTSPDRLLHSELSDAVTNAMVFPLRLTHITSGTAAAGSGAGLEFESESAGGTNRVAGTIENPYTTATNAAEVSDLVFRTMRAGTLTESLRSLGNGTLQIGTLSGTATQLMGATAANILCPITLGAGLSFSSGTLNGAFLPLTLTGTTEVNTAGQILRIRDAAGYPDVYMNSNYWTAASDVNTFIDVGSTSGQMQLNSAGRTIIAAATNVELQAGITGEARIDSDSLVLEGVYPVGTVSDSVLVRDGSTGRVNLLAQRDIGTWLKPELEAGNDVIISSPGGNELNVSGIDYCYITTDQSVELSSTSVLLQASNEVQLDADAGVVITTDTVSVTGRVKISDITNGDGVTLAAYTADNTLTSVTIDGTGNSGLLFDDGALTLSNNLSEVADTTTRTLGTGQQIYTNGYAAYSGSGFGYSSGRITNSSGATRLCKIRYYFTAETAGATTDALTVRVMIWDGATYAEHRAGRLTMTLNDDWELTGAKETIITLPDGDGVNIAFDSTDGLDVSNFGYVIEKI